MFYYTLMRNTKLSVIRALIWKLLVLRGRFVIIEVMDDQLIRNLHKQFLILRRLFYPPLLHDNKSLKYFLISAVPVR